MKKTKPKWRVKDRTRLLLAIMQALAGDAQISFEGDLRHFRLSQFAGASQKETAALRRSTFWPKQGFVVVPLEPGTETAILSAISGQVPKRIIHIQIEKEGVLQFGAYDNFNPECLFWGPGLKNSLFDSLTAQEVLEVASGVP